MCAPNEEAESPTDAAVQMVRDSKDTTAPVVAPRNWGPIMGAASLGLLIASTSVTMPHWMAQRDAVGCDSFCQGSMASLRSACSLTGAVLTGKWSDSKSWEGWGGARRLSLWAGVIGAAVSMHLSFSAVSVDGLLWSVVPSALLQQNLSVLKAVVSEYSVTNESERAAAQGMLGMSAGLAMMVGPVLGATLFPTYQSATHAGFLFLALAAILIAYLPVSQNKHTSKETNATKQRGFLSFLDVPSARSPPAIFLLTCRVLSTLSFHIFQTIWMVSLRDRFHFQSSGYGRFMSMVGLFLALSQFTASWVLDFTCPPGTANAPRNRVRLLAACFASVAMARFAVYQTNNVVVMYILFAAMVSAMGVATTILSADSTRVAAPDELGSFFGLQAAFENGAGMVGPMIGGVLGTYVHPVKAPMSAVLFLNVLVVVLVLARYESTVLQCREKATKVD